MEVSEILFLLPFFAHKQTTERFLIYYLCNLKIYQVPPANYEVIARVEASSEMGLTDQQSLDFALEEVKKQAAKVGANGVILNAVGKESTGGFGNFFSNGYGGGFFVGGDSYAQKISGTAIYVK